jgi:hypothetical protein
MAIPERKLEFNDFDPGELTLDELAMFDPEDAGIGTFNKLRKFLIDHSSWTAAEVGKIKAKELESITGQIMEAIERVVVPLESSSSSRTGRGSTAAQRRPAGQSISATQRNSAAIRRTSRRS